MVAPPKTKTEITIMVGQSHFSVYTKRTETEVTGDICTPRFVAAWFTTAEKDSSSNGHPRKTDEQKVMCAYRGISFRNKKTGNSDPCYNRDNTLEDKRLEDHINDKKPVSERQILCGSLLKYMIQSNLQRQK